MKAKEGDYENSLWSADSIMCLVSIVSCFKFLVLGLKGILDLGSKLF